MRSNYDMEEIKPAWCPGCGDFSILKTVKQTLDELNLPQEQVCFVSGIGQAAKLPQYLKVSYFNGLHGRTLPVATGIKLSNPELTVIVHSGDGCSYGEGGNHFIHTIRKNPNIKVFAHNNQIYGLTKGQTSPTTLRGQKTTSYPRGSVSEPFNPLAVAIALDASFVARAFSGDSEQTKEIMKKAIQHKGFALVDIFQPCVSFNKFNTFKWYKEHTYYLDEAHDVKNREKAFNLAIKTDKYPLGIFYINDNKSVLEDNVGVYDVNKQPLYSRYPNYDKIEEFLSKYK